MSAFQSVFIRIVAAALCTLMTPLMAAPVTYIFRASVNAELNGSAVAGPFVLTAQGDTSAATFNSGVWTLKPTSVDIDLDGQLLTIDAALTYIFDNQSSNKVGFGVNGIPNCCDIIQHQRADYGSYDLQSSIGPLSVVNNLSIGDFFEVPTSGGLLSMRSMESNSFQAVVGDVPEPGSLALLASAAVALLVVRRRI